MEEYSNACESLREYLKNIPFSEVWFYTGYFSDDDGNNSEFSFGPLKIQKQQTNMLEKLINESDIEKNWSNNLLKNCLTQRSRRTA